MKMLLMPSLLLVAGHIGEVQPYYPKDIIDTINSSGASWKAGKNFEEDVPLASIKKRLGVKDDITLDLPYRTINITIPDLPKMFDARKNWPQCESIGHIRDQGNCGSCWAVAAAGAFSDRLCIATNGTSTLPRSATQLLSCCTECGYGCDGGYPEQAFDYCSRNGLVTGGEYNSGVGCQPYEIPNCSSCPDSKTPACQSSCTNSAYQTSYSSDNSKGIEAYKVHPIMQKIQEDIITYGSVLSCFMVYEDFLTYKSGVYQHVVGLYLGGHAVKMIGWGEENRIPYWLMANQWGESWGDKGFFKILRGVNECNCESRISTVMC